MGGIIRRGIRMKLVHISTIHGPLDVRIFYKECRTLAEAGYEVHQAVFDPPAPSLGRNHVSCDSKVHENRATPSYLFTVYTMPIRPPNHLQADVYHFHDPELVPVEALLKLGGAKVDL